MRIVDQEWGTGPYKTECSAYMKTCAEHGDIENYWQLYTLVMSDGADNVWNRIFRDATDLPDEVRQGLLKVVRYMEYSQNIKILNPN